ncbi:hypothetical protein MQM1_014 [Aeromonas phage vB_AsaP_MQM1]|nr:hypothetical protein MQM1_014 [Aeromonas phage vB_AsaP_MQM1]
MEKLVLDITSESPVFSLSEVGIPGPRGLPGPRGPALTWNDLTVSQKLSLKGDKMAYTDLTPGDKVDLSQVAIEATKPYVKQAENAFVAAQSEAGKASQSASDAAASAMKALAAQTTSKPAPHTHPWSEITAKPDTATRWPNFDEIGNLPVDFTPKAHRQGWSTIDGVPETASRWPTAAEVGALDNSYKPLWGTIQGIPETATRWPTPTEVGATAADVGALPALGVAADSSKLDGKLATSDSNINTVVVRDANGDSSFRTVKITYQSQSAIPEGASVGFRTNNTDDAFVRFVSKGGLVNWLGQVTDSNLFAGKTVDQVIATARLGLVSDAATVNGKSLSSPVVINASDVGLGNVANYGNTSGWNGQSTTLYATQKAVYDAAFAPALSTERKRRVFYGTRPVIPEEGDVFIQL